jgi:nucleoside-diphosphate-sugar epimerase
MSRGPVLLTGATGFVGRALHSRLCAAGYDVRGGTRDPQRARRELPERCFVRYEALDPVATRAALRGCRVAYYLSSQRRTVLPGSP